MNAILKIALTLCFAAGNAAAQENSLLWKVTGNGLKKPSYIFGTVHLICKDDFFWTSAMERSLAASEKVCLEVDLDDPATMAASMAGMVDTSGKAIDQYFSDNEFGELKKFFGDSMGVDLSMFSKMKPFALESMISMMVAGCSDARSYEEHIMDKAKKQKKEILGLETAEEQLKVLETLPIDSLTKDMMNEISDFGKSRNEYQELIAAYKNQDLSKLHNMIKSGFSGGGMSPFLDDRNVKWIPLMEKMMARNAVFFAVGSGHLAGENGVVLMLRKAGYKVTPLK